MKPQHIYFFKTKAGSVHEGILILTINGVHIFRSLPFQSTELVPRTVLVENVEWAEEVCPWTAFTTESMYHDALHDLANRRK